LQQQQQQPNASSSSAASSGAGSSSDTISSLDTTDGQIYTLTVLNGGEPWLKRSEAEQLPTSLDLDSLLGSFPGYIKSEYPYDDSGFSTDGKDVIGNGTDGLSSISQAQNQQGQQTQQTLPSLVTAISLAGGNDLGQQLAQFQNNNNDWHMADHNTETEQSTAESLLRSALQGKGYAKGLHMQNGLTSSNTSNTSSSNISSCSSSNSNPMRAAPRRPPVERAAAATRSAAWTPPMARSTP